MKLPIIYAADDCARCEHVKSVLRTAGVEFETRSAKDWLLDSFHPDWREQRSTECRAVLAFHDDQLPVIDSRGNEELRLRLVKLWSDNPIPRCCEDNVCALKGESGA